MKKIILSISLLLLTFVANAQKSRYLVDEYGNPKHYEVQQKFGKCNIFLVVDSGTKQVTPFEYLTNFPLGNIVLLKGAKSIEIESRIQKDSLAFYRYSIIENDSIVLKKDAIPTKIKYKWGSGSILPNYVAANLGVFNAVNKKIEVQIYRIDLKSHVTSVIIYNKPIFAPKSLSFKLLGENSVRSINNNASLAVNESVKGIRVSMENTDFNMLYSIMVENIDAHSSAMLEPEWKVIKSTNTIIGDIDVKDFTTPGKYRVSVYPKTRTYSFWKDNTLARNFFFTIEKPKESFFTSKDLLKGGAIGCIFGIILVLILNSRKKREARILAQKSQEKEIAKLQLDSVRSQLNPHFLFNALAGIQTLMNKNEIDNANRYLTKFARLTRNVLDHKELISLTSEKTLLDDYLQMEQLRFGFQYQITASPDLDVENIEIPAMLLQPFVENAVKHGIAAKGGDGKIEIDFTKKETDVILSVKDNGGGFDTAKDYAGLGLALTKNRISLFNSIYKETPFLLDMKADANGTLIRITINQWL
ncbi:sensor histidine kinase [Pedobacter roseus]|uniref:Histidine kinase n=1 Tax=Pedobacter roseus TaxID=336820 RepID=A0A7G9QF74_9SPHI|nr:histidine kinase [Pedobacter roseus]QNN41999.1 histidine kinase [Pedobacter roseus]